MLRKVLIGLIVLFGLYYVFLFSSISGSLKIVFKLLPMILIIGLAIWTEAQNIRTYKMLVVIALIFCAIGDYTLQWFLIGLSSFLVGHLFYLCAFLSTKEKIVPFYVKLLLAVYGGIMMFWIGGTVFKSGENILTIAVCAYILVILTMGWASFRTGSSYAMIGALLFIASDTILAINKFVFSIEFSHELIMATYYGAQLCITLSIANYSAFRSKNDTI